MVSSWVTSRLPLQLAWLLTNIHEGICSIHRESKRRHQRSRPRPQFPHLRRENSRRIARVLPKAESRPPRVRHHCGHLHLDTREAPRVASRAHNHGNAGYSGYSERRERGGLRFRCHEHTARGVIIDANVRILLGGLDPSSGKDGSLLWGEENLYDWIEATDWQENSIESPASPLFVFLHMYITAAVDDGEADRISYRRGCLGQFARNDKRVMI